MTTTHISHLRSWVWSLKACNKLYFQFELSYEVILPLKLNLPLNLTSYKLCSLNIINFTVEKHFGSKSV